MFWLLLLAFESEGDDEEEEGCGRRPGADGVVDVDDCVLELLWNHSHSLYLHVKSPSLPWEMESPQTRILTVFVSGLEVTAEAAEGELLSVAESGRARPLVRGAAIIMAVMAERNAEARILPRQTGSRLMSYITSTWLASQYAREWAMSSIFVDMWEKRIERNLGTAAFLLWGFLDVSRGEGGVLAGCY